MKNPYNFKTACLAALAVLVTLTLAKHLAALGVNGTLVYTVAAAVQLYLPVWLTRKESEQYQKLGLATKGLKSELLVVLLLAVVIFPLYAVGHHFFQTWFMGRIFGAPVWGSWLDFGNILLTQFFAVALPEELFYRGYLQTALEAHWPARRRLFGVPFGLAIVVTAALFALGHFLGEYNPIRLGPFFPALIFSWLKGRRGSLWGAVTFHALCNIFSGYLFKFYGG